MKKFGVFCAALLTAVMISVSCRNTSPLPPAVPRTMPSDFVEVPAAEGRGH